MNSVLLNLQLRNIKLAIGLALVQSYNPLNLLGSLQFLAPDLDKNQTRLNKRK